MLSANLLYVCFSPLTHPVALCRSSLATAYVCALFVCSDHCSLFFDRNHWKSFSNETQCVHICLHNDCTPHLHLLHIDWLPLICRNNWSNSRIFLCILHSLQAKRWNKAWNHYCTINVVSQSDNAMFTSKIVLGPGQSCVSKKWTRFLHSG